MKWASTILVATMALLALPMTAAAVDRDGDRLPDRWEKRHGLSVKKRNAKADPDRDHLSNLAEYRSHTKPKRRDSDRDGVHDGDEDPDRDRVDHGSELEAGTKPLDRDSDDDGRRDGDEDSDRDRLRNAGEDTTGNDAGDPDTDDDGIKDGAERAGEIVSFDGEQLTIALAVGGTISGLVTEDTEVECETEDDHDSGKERERSGKAGMSTYEEDEEPGEEDFDDPDEWDEEDEDFDEEPGEDEWDEDGKGGCSIDDLEAGIGVHEAELRVTSDGVVFKEIELLK